MRTWSRPARLVVLFLAGLVPLPLRAAEEIPPFGFDALLGFDRLPLLADWPAYQDSSYHRENTAPSGGTGGKHRNQDAGNFLRVEPDGEQVLVDTDGPVVVYRLWSTGVVGQMSDRCRLRFHSMARRSRGSNLSIRELLHHPEAEGRLEPAPGQVRELERRLGLFAPPPDPDRRLRFAARPGE